MIDSPCDTHVENMYRQSFCIPPSQIDVDDNKDSEDHDDEYGEPHQQNCETVRQRQHKPQSWQQEQQPVSGEPDYYP